MFEFWGSLLSVIRTATGLTVMLYWDENDTDPLTYHTTSFDPYVAAGLVASELDVCSESELIQLGEVIDANL